MHRRYSYTFRRFMPLPPMGTGGSFLAGPWPNLIGYQHGQCARQYGL